MSLPFVFSFFNEINILFHFSYRWFRRFVWGNVFGHTTLKNDFPVLDLDDCYNNSSSAFVSYFDSNSESVKWHAGLRHIGQVGVHRLAK